MKKLLINIIALLPMLAANAEPPKYIEVCAGCHGENGVSSNSLWPNLAGQQIDYMVKELRAFRDGSRSDPTMPADQLQALNDEDFRAIAEYYSAMPAAKPAPVEAGEPGQNERAFCVSCHGMDGITVTSIWPNLAAQKEGYLHKQLLDYKTGKRQHPIMEVIVNELSEEQLAAVAKYYSQH